METVGEDARLEPAAEEPAQPVLRDDRLGGGDVPDARRVHLAVRLDDAERVRDRVRDDGRAEADERLPEELRADRRGRRERAVEVVVRPEPRVVPDERRRGGRERAVPERADAVALDLRAGGTE